MVVVVKLVKLVKVVAVEVARPGHGSNMECMLTSSPPSGMKAAIKSAYTGSLAEHVINGATRIVVIRSLGS